MAILFDFDTADQPIIFKKAIISGEFTIDGKISYNVLLYRAGAIFLWEDTVNINVNSHTIDKFRGLIIDSLSIDIRDNDN